MVFNNLFTPKNKHSTSEYFLAVEIHESLIKTAVWQVADEIASIVSLGSYELWDSENSLINGIDASLSEAIKGLESKPDRVILGLPDSWLSENKIHPTKQNLVKHLLSELDLRPIGMVTITEALVSHLKKQEGVPPTAILLEIYPSKVIVSLINLGEIQAQEEVGRSDDLARDVEEGLARFDAEKLPARFILTNGSNLENEEQQIISYPWTEKLPFLHLPKVQVLPIDFSIRAIALSGGAEAAKSLGLEIMSEESAAVIEEFTSDFSSLGFSVEGEPESVAISEEEEVMISVPVDDSIHEQRPKTNILSKLPRLALPKFSLPKFTPPTIKRGLILWLIPLIIIVLLLGTIGFYFYLGTVKVILTISPTRVSQTIDTVIGTAPKDNLFSIIAAKKTLSAKESGSLSTTGETTVGEKAAGKIVIYNLSPNQSYDLKAGTKIVSGNLIYTLNSALSIASTSGQISDSGTITLSSASGNATASRIGAEYNLDKGTIFSIDNYPKSVLQAKADVAFTGGSSRTVKAVSKADQDKLLEQVSNKIKSNIDNQFKKDDPNNRSLVTGAIRYTTKNFDRNVGQEATTVDLDLGADLDVLVYSQKNLLDQIEKKILTNADPGLHLASDKTQISLTDPTPLDNNTFSTKVQVEAVLLPKIDEANIISAVKGKNISILQARLHTIPGFISAKVLIYPPIPLLSSFLPLKSDRYSFITSTQ